MPIIDIPLSRLTTSPLNVRKTRNKEAIEQMASSIESLGLIQNLTVHEVDGNFYGAAIGGTRYEALKLLEKEGRSADGVPVTGDYPVPCDVRPSDDPNLTAKSLAENFNRDRMHPLDESEAFASLASTGHGPIEIAARYGTTPRIVQQRQKLANISPKLKAIFRKGEMSLDQAQAFTLADGDHKRQEKVWREMLPWAREQRSGDFIRGAITEKHIAADSGIAKFVSLTAYEEAGGHIVRDLFAEKDEGHLTDQKILFKLAEEKLAEAAATIRAEGWKWVREAPSFDWEEENKHGRMTPTRTEPTAEQMEEIRTLTAKAESVVAEHGDEPSDEAAYNELEAALNRIEELSAGEQVWTLEQKAVAGVLITIGHSGELLVKRGLIKPEDKAAAKKVQGVTREAQDEKPKPAKKKGGLSAALVAELTSHKTAAAQLELANNANVALLAVTHALALRAFHNPYDQHTSLRIVAHETTFPMALNEQIDKSPAGKKFSAVVKAWQKRLPKEPGQLWDWVSEQKRDVVLGLLAVSAAHSVDMVQPHGVKADAAADALMTALKVDMSSHWHATEASYLGRVSKDLILAAVEEAYGEGETTGLPTKKAELAKAAEKNLKGRGWLPAVLKVG